VDRARIGRQRALGWIVAKANRLFNQEPGKTAMQVKDYMTHFGLKGSPSQRAVAMLRAGGFPPEPDGSTSALRCF